MTKELTEALISWYQKNKRILPWRDQGNAYYTWISEIMLQQTRVEAVKPYFLRFVEDLPDIPALASCPEERLLKLWEGLGYYSRARNLQTAARQVMEDYGGKLPASFDELLKLKGIGRYTAGAVASIAYGIPVPAVDGNVLRVVMRLLGSREDISRAAVKTRVEEFLKTVIPADSPGDFNQALMELGAVICVPNGPPKCESCPAAGSCEAYRQNIQDQLPLKTAKKERKIEERTILVIQDGDRTVIRKRPEKGLLAGLYELPGLSGFISREEALAFTEKCGFLPLFIEELPRAKHIFSHIEWRMKAYRIRVSSIEELPDKSLLLLEKGKNEKAFAIPSAFSAYTKYLKGGKSDETVNHSDSLL